MDKSQSKYLNTAKKMQSALINLLDKVEFDDVTISLLCKRAGVNRTTFYAHYDNLYDLLEEMQESVINSFFEEQTQIHTTIEKLNKEDSVFINEKYLIPYLNFIKDNKNLFKLFMKNLNVFSPNKILKFFIDDVFTPILSKHDIKNSNQINYMAQYYLMGVTAITNAWVKNDCKESVEEICKIIINCVRPEFY